jgi:hypothetical protein
LLLLLLLLLLDLLLSLLLIGSVAVSSAGTTWQLLGRDVSNRVHCSASCK